MAMNTQLLAELNNAQAKLHDGTALVREANNLIGVITYIETYPRSSLDMIEYIQAHQSPNVSKLAICRDIKNDINSSLSISFICAFYEFVSTRRRWINQYLSDNIAEQERT